MSEPKAMSPEDIYRFRWASDPRISPDGSRVAFVVSWIDREADEYRSAIYLAPSDGSAEARRLTYGPKQDTHPRWSPDGTSLLFLSERDGKAQVHVLPLDGGEAWKLTRAENGTRDAVWSPDGRRIAFVSTTGIRADEEPKDVVAYYFTEAEMKHDGAGIKRGRDHVFVQALDSEEAVQVTSGDDDYGSPRWSPDGSTLAVVSGQDEMRPFTSVSDVYLVPADGGEARRLTPGRYPFHSAEFSPDGRSIAFLGHLNPPDTGLSSLTRLWLVPIEGGEPECLTPEWDRSIGNSVLSDSRWGEGETGPAWSADGSRVLFIASDRGASNVYSLELASGGVSQVTTGPRMVDGFTLAGDRVAYVAADLLDPGDVYVSALDGSGEVRLTRLNEELLSEYELSRPEEVSISSTEGTEVQGWLLRPRGFREGERYPLVIEVHGGPHSLYGHSFFHEFQVLAATGYGVLFTNPRGSAGYGQRFQACIARGWGERDFQDVMAVADWAAALPWVDPERMGITGGSYGGFLTNWVVGHTDRFRAAATQRCVSNFASFYGTSDIGPIFSEWQVGGTPWDNPEGYRRASPITYVENIRTPLLILHSEQDHRCPVEQAEQLFVALKRLGREAEFVRFPQESHGLSRGGKPARRVERLRRLVGWFERHVPPNCAGNAAQG